MCKLVALIKSEPISLEIRCFKPIEQAKSASKDVVCECVYKAMYASTFIDHPDYIDDGSTAVDAVVQKIQGVLGNSVAARWYQMGTILGVEVGELEMIRSEANTSALEKETMMLKAWLKSLEDSSDDTTKTWQWLVDSVGHSAGGKHPKKAKELSQCHPGNIFMTEEKL